MAFDGSINIDARIDTKKIKGGLSKLSKSVTGAVGGITKAIGGVSIAATAAITGFAVSSAKQFASFEQGMNEVFTLLPDITGDAMKEMEGQVKDFSKEFGTLPDEVVPALYQSLSAGVPQDNVFEFLEVAQKAAKGGVAELATAVDGISSVVNAYGSDVIDATKVSDLMFTAVKKGKTTFDEMSASLFQVIPTAASLGVGFEEVTAAIATMTAQGTPTSVATTQMRQLFVELSKSGNKTADMFKNLAGKSFKDFIADGGDVIEALSIMSDHAETNGLSISDMFGSVEAGNAALALSGKNAFTFADNLDEMAESAGATDKAFETMDSGINATMGRIAANFATLQLDVGDLLAPALEDAATGLLETINLIKEPVMEIFEGIIGIMSGDESAVESLTNGLTSLLDMLITAIVDIAPLVFDVFIGVMKGVAQTMLDVAPDLFQTAKDVFIDLVATFVDMLPMILEFGSNVLTWLIDGINSMMPTLLDNALKIIPVIVRGIFEALPKVVDAAISVVKTFVEYVINHLPEILWAGAQIIFFLLKGIFSSFGKILQMFDDIGTMIDNAILRFAENVFIKAKEIGGNIARGIWEGIKNMAGWVSDKVGGFLSGIVDKAKDALGIHSPSRVFESEIGENIALGTAKGVEGKFSKVAKSVSGMLSGLSDNISANMNVGMMQPAMAGNTSVQNDFRGMFEGATFSVRSDADIKNLAKETSRALERNQITTERSRGYVR